MKNISNDRIVILTLSASYLLIVGTLCIGLFIDKVDNKQIFGILQIFFNSGLLVYLGVIKNSKDKESSELSRNIRSSSARRFTRTAT